MRLLKPIYSGLNHAGLVKSLGPVAWFRHNQGITVTGSGVSEWSDASGNSRPLLQGTDANRPFALLHEGEKYAWNNGVASNTLTAVNVSVTGDMTVAFDGTLNDYTPASDVTLISKLSGNNGFALLLLTTGVIRLRVGNGASVTNVDSTVACGVTDRTRCTLSAVWTDGVGASFYVTGVQIGDSVVAAVTLTNAATTLTIGPWAGKMYRGVVTNSGAMVYYDALPADAAGDATSWVAASTGQTWTVNQSGATQCQIVGRSSILFDGTAHLLKCASFTLNQPETVYLLLKQVSWTATDTICDGNANNSGALQQNTSSPQFQMTAGTGVALNGNLAIGSVGVVAAVFNGASSLIQVNQTTPTTGNAGAANMGGFTLGAIGDGSMRWASIQAYEAIVFPTAHDATTRARLIRSLGRVVQLGI